ncbi:putative chromatin-remodeling ATPase INO80-like 5 [Homarus americanus]|uniref:Putative chromatin-remodeling ATPase INO80-like 5 n=1 Tax=Homarus americanus TaxID=6706 RepID=A0A8J5JJG8_HOMAM|nr:putative chromatin-remodeling ATPase INO80-like 5 [Homarus americanus]
MPAPRPTTLAVPISPLPQPPENAGARPHSRHSSLSYLSSPMDVDPWEGEAELPDSALSWRGSEFETSTPRLTSDIDLPSPRPTSGLSLSSLHETFCEGESEVLGLHDSPKLWRSPQLERQRYIQKGQEERYREALKRRTQRSATPTNVVELASCPPSGTSPRRTSKLSPSRSRRESRHSSEKEGSFGLPERESCKTMEKKESNRLLEWMQQYKAQESRDSTRSQELKDSESLGYAESARSLDGTDSLGSMESKDSFGTVARRKSLPFPSGAEADSSTGVRRRDSLKELLERREPSRSLEKAGGRWRRKTPSSFRTRGSIIASWRRETPAGSLRGRTIHGLYTLAGPEDSARSVDGGDSGPPLQRRDSGRLKRRNSGRVERRDSDRVERRAQVERLW